MSLTLELTHLRAQSRSGQLPILRLFIIKNLSLHASITLSVSCPNKVHRHYVKLKHYPCLSFLVRSKNVFFLIYINYT